MWAQTSETQGCGDYDNGGLLLQNEDSADVASCKIQCEETPGCQFLTFYATTTWCSLFTKCTVVDHQDAPATFERVGGTITAANAATLTIAAAPVALAAPDCAGGCTAILSDAAGAVPVAGLPDPQCHLHVQAGVQNTMRVGLYDAHSNAQVPVSTVPHRFCNR